LNDEWDSLVTVLGVKLKSALVTAASAIYRFFGGILTLPEALLNVAEAQEEVNAANDAYMDGIGRSAKGTQLRKKAADEALKIAEEELAVMEKRITLESRRGQTTGPTGPPTININGVNEANRALASYEKAILSAELATTLIGDKVKILHRLMLDGAISQKTYTEALEEFAAVAGVEAPAALDTMALAAGNLAATGISDMVDGFIEGEKSFSGLVESFLKGIAKMIVQQMIFNAISQTALGGYMGLSARATGGPVARGSSYIVGERGPELFSPSSSGHITPNNKLGGATTVNINNYASAEVEVNETQSATGETTLDVKISDMVRREIKRGGFDRQNRAVYGLSRVGY